MCIFSSLASLPSASYPRKTRVMGTRRFIEGQSTQVCHNPNMKQPNCLPRREQIQKLWLIYMMKYYTAMAVMNHSFMDQEFYKHTEQEKQISKIHTHTHVHTRAYIIYTHRVCFHLRKGQKQAIQN